MYLGVDLGGTNIAVGLVDEEYSVLRKDSVPTGKLRSVAEIMDDIAALCRKVTEEAGYRMEDVKSIGIGSPGVPDVVAKKLVYNSTIVNFVDVSVEKELQKYFPGMPVYIENDANAAAYGEIVAGAAKEFSTALVVTLGTGVGGGIVINNKIYAGFNHAGGEIGHMVIVKDGVPCPCGRSGCFESYASATALIRETAEIIQQYPDSIIHEMIGGDPAKIEGKTAFLAARQGDEAGRKIVEQYIEYLGTGVANLINIFQPEALVIGGGISKEGENLLAPLRAYVQKNGYTLRIPQTRILAAKLGNDAGIIGAAMLWQQA